MAPAVPSPPAASSSPRIPFTVIGGFLGAGKTTLLLRWLRGAQGRRIAVLVNDFGAINLDAALVAQAGADTIALSNGCVCCSIGDDLGAALGRVLAATPRFDAVVVEASGVGDPWRIAQYALAEPLLQLHGVVVLVDATALAGHRADPLLADSLSRPLAHADLVLLNHADRASAAELAAAEQWVAADAAARAATPPPLLVTTQADLPLQSMDTLQYRPHGGGLSTERAAHDQRFEACQLPAAGVYDAQRLRHWLGGLPAGVLRLKGWLPVAAAPGSSPLPGAGPGWVDLQFAGRHGTLRRADPPAPPTAGLVAIGLAGQLPTQALAAGLAACAADTSTP